jgi:inner membrane transporter RhtA
VVSISRAINSPDIRIEIISLSRIEALLYNQGMSSDASITSSSGGPAVAHPSARPGIDPPGLVLCLLSMSCIQFGAALSAQLMRTIGVLPTSCMRLSWAGLLLLVLIRPPIRSYTRRQWRSALLLGLASAAMTLLFFAAVDRIPLGLAVAIEFLGPLGVATAAALRSGGSARASVWPLLALAGVVLLSRALDGRVEDGLGIAFAIGAAVGWAAYIVLTQKVGAAFQGLQGLAMSITAAALFAAPFGVATLDALPSLAQLAATFGLALMVPLAPYACELVALRRLPTATFGILMSLEPAIGALAGWMLLDQALTGGQLAGTVLVVAASWGASRMASGVSPQVQRE